jgi:hypothetical protein
VNQHIQVQVDHPQAFLVPEAIYAITVCTHIYPIYTYKDFVMPGISLLTKSQTPTTADKPKSQTYLEVGVTFAHSEIHLLEDSSNPESRAFVFNSSFMVTYVKSNQHRDLKIYNKKLEIYKCFITRKVLNDKLHLIFKMSTAVSILDPLDFSIHSSKVQNVKPQMTVTIDSMHMALSYRVSVLQVVNNIL